MIFEYVVSFIVLYHLIPNTTYETESIEEDGVNLEELDERDAHVFPVEALKTTIEEKNKGMLWGKFQVLISNRRTID